MAYCLIDSKKFAHNIKIISEHIGLDKIAFVVKNNAYGHGLIEMSELAQKNKIKNAVVINIGEANRIKKYFESVLVLSGIPNDCPSENIYIAINDIDDIAKMPPNTQVELGGILAISSIS